MSPCYYLNGNAIVGLDHVASGLQEGIVLDLSGVHQNFVTIFILAVLTGDNTSSIFVRVQEVAVNRDVINLPYEVFTGKAYKLSKCRHRNCNKLKLRCIVEPCAPELPL